MAQDNVRGIIWMLVAMLAFAFGDTFLKLLAGAVAAGQLLILTGIGGALIFGVLAWRAGATNWLVNFVHPGVFARTCCEGLAATGFILAFASAPLSIIAAIMQTNPLIVTLGAALLLKERVGPRRWGAIALGLLGMMIVIRPWGEAFEPTALYALVGTVFLSARDLLTRFVPDGVPTVQLGVYAMAFLLPTGAVVQVIMGSSWTSLDASQSWILLGSIAMIPLGFFGATQSMRLGEVSAVAPFRYARLIFALILAAIVFGERPDLWTYLGASIVVCSGLYAMWRERVVQKA